jgi:hypothetical protein
VKLFLLPILLLIPPPILPMESPKACGPLPEEAVYTDLSTVIAAITRHIKANGYALFKRDAKPKRIVFTYDRYSKL